MSDLTERLRRAFAAWAMRSLGDEAADEIERLRKDCSELYQVIGVLADRAGLWDHHEVNKALDNACAAADGEPRPHDDLLPFNPTKENNDV